MKKIHIVLSFGLLMLGLSMADAGTAGAALASVATQDSGADTTVDLEAERAAVLETTMNYVEGAYTASAERMAKAVHPELNKVTLVTLPQTGTCFLRNAGSSRLVEVVRGMQVVPEDKRNIRTEILDIGDDMAVVLMDSSDWHDLLQIAKVDGEWKIVNVLWVPNPESAGGQRNPHPEMDTPEAEAAAVRAAALDYIEGAYSGDAERMARGVHPQLNKVVVVTHPRTGHVFLDKMSSTYLIEGTRAGLGLVPEGERNIEIEIYDVNYGIAALKVTSAMYIDHLQLAKVSGQWRIVNVLWAMNPDAPARR